MTIQKYFANFVRRVINQYLKIILIVIGTMVLAGSLGSRILKDTAKYNLYSYQAQAFLHGRIDVSDVPIQLGDTAVFEGKIYVAFPPFPAIVLLPFIAIFGTDNTKPMLIAIGLTIFNLYLFTSIFRRIDTTKKYIPWLVAAFFLGTGYWYVLRESTYVWQFAHIVTTSCLLLTINEAFGKARGALIGLYFGMAVLSRQNTIFYIIFLSIILWNVTYPYSQDKKRLLNLFWMFAMLGLWGGFYLYLNWLRFGNIFDTGYAYIQPAPGFLEERVARYGLFNVVYIPSNFIYMFLQGFQIEFNPANAYLGMMYTNPFGTSLTFASPFLFIALYAKWKKSLLLAAWLSIGFILCVILFYYNNGWIQLNTQRFALDFIPILMLLVASGMQRVDIRISQAAIYYSLILNILALFVVPLVVRLTS